MLLIGLTGSIATGKSTVSSLLSSSPYSLPIIDADVLARKVVEPGSRGYRKIVSHFGPTTPDLLYPDTENKYREHGAPINRPVLGRRVFGDTEERKRDRLILNGIVHPAIRWEMFKSVMYYYLRGYWAVVLDIPLLFESRLDTFCSTVLVVATSDPAIQMRRLRERDPHLSAEDAENRVKSQVDIREKAKRAFERSGGTGDRSGVNGNGRAYVLYNDESKDELKTELAKIFQHVKATSPEWWSWLLLLCPPVVITTTVWQFLKSWLDGRKWERSKAGDKAKL